MPFLALALIVLLGVGGAWGYLSAIPQAKQLEADISRDFTSAQAHIEAGKAALEKANTDRSLTSLATARSDFLAAQADFNRARGRVDGNLLLRIGPYLPFASGYIGPRERAVVGLTDMGMALSAAALEGVDVDALLLAPGGTGQGTAKLLGVLKTAQPKIAVMNRELEKAKAALATVDPSVLPAAQRPAVVKTGQTVDKAIISIGQLTALVPALLHILGGDGPHTYLIEQVNPAELRGGGGFIGSYSLLTADQGVLKLIKSEGIENVDYPRSIQGQAGYVQPPVPMQEFIGGKSWVLGDSNFYPDFPTNAKWGETFAEKEIKVKPDGVISIDPYLIATLLEVTGPIKVADYGVTVESKTFVSDLFVREAGAARTSDRKSFLGSVATQLMTDVAALPPDRWPKLLQALNSAAATRHLQVYFNDPGAEKQMSAFGWSGDLNTGLAPDYMYEVESNFGATKANYFLQRNYSLQLSLSGNVLHHKVTVSLKDSTPPGFNGGRHYRCYMRLYIPDAASAFTISPVKPDDVANTDVPKGLKMADGWFQVDVGLIGYGTYSVTFQYDTPWTADADGKHRIYWQKQPGTLNDSVSVDWLTGGHHYAVSGDLGQDRLLTLAPAGVTLETGQAGSAQLPTLSF